MDRYINNIYLNREIKRGVTRRAALADIAMLGLGPILAACSSRPRAAAPASPRRSVPATASPVAAPIGAAPARVTLSFSYWASTFSDMFPLLQQKTGVVIQGAQSSWHGYQEKLIAGLVAGTAPDFFTVDTYFNGEIFPSGLIVPFDDYLASRGDVDMAKWNIDQRRENGYQGKILGLSFFTAQDMIVHLRKDLADKDGLLKNLPEWGTPSFDTWTWAKWVEWLQAGTKIRSDGTVEQYGLGLDVSSEVELLKIFTYMSGGAEFDDAVWNYRESRANLDQAPFLEAAQFVADLVRKKIAPTPGAEKAIPGGAYLAKRAMSSIAWSTPSFVPDELDQQTWIHLPFNKQKTHRVGANYFAVNKASKHVEAALAWSTTFCVDLDARARFLQTSSVPAYDPLPIVNAAPAGPAKTIALINLSRIPSMSPIPGNAQNVVLYPGWDGRDPHFTDDTLSAAMQSVTVGGNDLKSAFAAAKAKIEADLTRTK